MSETVPTAAAVQPAPARIVPKTRAKRRSWGRWATLAILLAAIGGGAYGYHAYYGGGGATTQEAAKTVKVERGNVEKRIESSGKVVSNLDVDIKCRASGEIVQLPFDVSDKVKKGDLLCQLDPVDEQLAVKLATATVDQSKARVEQAKANVAQAEAALVTTRTRNEATLASVKVRAENARAKADRQKQLIDQQLGSREEYESAETEAASAVAELKAAEVAIQELKQQEIALESKRQDLALAQASLEADQIQLDTRKRNLEYTTVTSPMDGTVSALTVQKGVIVASGTNNVSGGTTIMTISDLSRVFVTATVDESDIGGVKVDQKARITVDSFPGRVFAGKVVRVAVKGTAASNVVTFEVKIEVLDDRKDLLKPEMTGNITIVEQDRQNVLTLPADAVTRQGPNAFVTMKAGNERRPVKLGVQGEDKLEIVSGVNEGDEVVITEEDQSSRFRAGAPGGQRRGPRPPF